MKLKEIIKEEEYKLIKGYFIIIKREKNINKIIKFLSENYKLPKYLKRINNNSGNIRCLVSFKKEVFIIIDKTKYLIESILLPNRPPLNKKEYEEFKSFWSVNYFPSLTKQYFFNELHIYSLIKLNTTLDDFSSFICSTVCLIIDTKSNYTFPILFTSDKLPWSHSVFKTIKYVCQSEYNYLCTDLDIYILNSPCFGCCSALLHARISNVFIFDNNNNNNEFTKYFIHQNNSFNHKFRVFEVI